MPYEDFDKKVRDAADHHHPAYDEQAWGKMETLLDTHMPQEKEDRRRFIFFLLFFLLLGGAVLLVTKPWSSGKSIAAKESTENITKQKTAPENTATKNAVSPESGTSSKKIISYPEASSPESVSSPQSEAATQSNTIETNLKARPINNSVNSSQKKNNKPGTLTKVEYSTSAASIEKKSKKKQNQVVTNTVTTASALENDNQQASTVPEKKDDILASKKNTVAANNKTNDTPLITTDKKSATTLATETIVKKDEADQQKEIKKEKPKLSKSNSFFFSLSAGPDVSGAAGNKPGKTKLLAGVGFGYTIKNKLTIRTGFYSGRKVYAASPDEYNPPADFWNYYPYLEKVEADCKVYEIPVSLSYNFGKSAKYNWVASAGLSTYLMKKEVYNYYYKYLPNTPTLNAKWTVEDENKHLFSVVTLSGGYQRRINNTVSLMVEPYIKLPLSGVGYGKVKLNSGGILVTLSIKPFQKTTKEK